MAGTANGLNQLTSVGGTSNSHDARGNVTAIGGSSYGYSSESLLTSAPSSTTLAYDPAGRLYETVGAATTRFGYDGLQMIAEYNSSNVLQRRYVFGPGTDEPLVWYEDAGTSTRRYFHADERGSVVAVSDGSGAEYSLNTYDEYGIPGAGNSGRFQYTGQAWLPELGMSYYRARIYSPTLGRFMQTEPIGYDGGMNLYAYVLIAEDQLHIPVGGASMSLNMRKTLFLAFGCSFLPSPGLCAPDHTGELDVVTGIIHLEQDIIITQWTLERGSVHANDHICLSATFSDRRDNYRNARRFVGRRVRIYGRFIPYDDLEGDNIIRGFQLVQNQCGGEYIFIAVRAEVER